jgi:hypothetical protein
LPKRLSIDHYLDATDLKADKGHLREHLAVAQESSTFGAPNKLNFFNQCLERLPKEMKITATQLHSYTALKLTLKVAPIFL